MLGRGRWLAGAAVAAAALAPQSAHAFCRTTTCDSTDNERSCQSDRRGCIVDGEPLFWPGQCVSFSVHRDASPRRGISFEHASEIIENAFRAWSSVDCGGGRPPSLQIWNFGPVECNETQFNQLEPNANAWIFRDEGWPYQGANATLALTTLTYEVNTGEILDADVEVNSNAINLTTSDRNVDNDLLSIATHEAGHFLGLNHTNVPNATMNADYSPGQLSFRSLEPDDQAGICAAYPPEREVSEQCTPRPLHGFSRLCGTGEETIDSGCALTHPSKPSGPGSSTGGPLVLLLGVGLGVARRRRRVLPDT